MNEVPWLLAKYVNRTAAVATILIYGMRAHEDFETQRETEREEARERERERKGERGLHIEEREKEIAVWAAAGVPAGSGSLLFKYHLFTY